MQIYFETVYHATVSATSLKILILYNISSNHYVGFPIYDANINGAICLKSIQKYIKIEEIMDISKKSIKRPVYAKGQPLRITTGERLFLNKEVKKYFLQKIDSNLNYKIQDDISCIKWDSKKIELNKNCNQLPIYNQNQIVWIDFGFNVGSELRKLRPAILWRASSDKKMWTVIPLSTKCLQDGYYFHYDLTSLNDCTAKIESLANFSAKRIVEPYYNRGKTAYLNNSDYEKIKKILKEYYAFEHVVVQQI